MKIGPPLYQLLAGTGRVIIIFAVVFWIVPFPALLQAQQASICHENSPDREKLAKAIENGDTGFVKIFLSDGGDVNETWRDTPYQICRSVLLRSVWHGQEELFHLLLERGGDPADIQGFLQNPVRRGNVGVVRTLLQLGVKPEPATDILKAAFESGSPEMVDLLLHSGVTIHPLELPLYHLTDHITRYLVPEHLDPNENTYLGTEPCQVEKLFGLLSEDRHYCEGTIGPFWMHFVLTGNYDVAEFMFAKGADVNSKAIIPIPFTGLQAAEAMNDTLMIQLIRIAAGEN